MPRKELTTVVPEPGTEGSSQVEVMLPLRERRRKANQNGEPCAGAEPINRPRIPRITRLMALAIKFQDMVECGEVCDYAELARLGYVTRARITQIMNMLNLAPDIQEDLLTAWTPAAVNRPERGLRQVTAIVEWRLQRNLWKELLVKLKVVKVA